MEVVREYPADDRTAATRTGLVGPAGVPGGVARMSNGLGLCRRQLGQRRVPYTGMAQSSAATLVASRGKSHTISVIVGRGRHKSSWRGGDVVKRARGPGVVLKRRFLEQEHGDFEELPFGVEDVDVTRAVGEEEMSSNVLEVLVSMVRVLSNEGRVSRCRIMSTRVAKRESSPLTVYMTRNLVGYDKRNDFIGVRWWLGWSITSSHGNQLGGDDELAERRRVRSG
uniref:Uncharacterized protein n=1 Tax=Tanacetum cinerariifolium TaxID=118510 RepID=A0A6L2JSX1_TANCI|nr:hypothetical protein [Tanacetum cinerariifolium]